jgi:transposase
MGCDNMKNATKGKEYAEHIKRMLAVLNEKQRRIFLASEAIASGHGGVKLINEISGVSRTTIIAGKKEIVADRVLKSDRVRRSGGGRKFAEEKYPEIQEKILEIVDGATYGNPENPLSWTTESLRKIQSVLRDVHEITVTHNTVGSILESLGYSKQSNQKMLQLGKEHPDRNAQFKYINAMAKRFLNTNAPVISVDTKKKENIGNFKNCGQEYRKGKDPRRVLDHDFPIEDLGKIAPYGIYVLNDNTAFVNVGTSHDTSEFAVKSISRWWETVCRKTYPKARKILITCDCGGSNGYRVRMWKYQLQQLANRTKLKIHVSHFPPGTSKWNKVEHRLFCYISKNWQGKPLIDIETAVKLIGSTTTEKGLKVICEQDNHIYELAQKVTDEELNMINIKRIGKHGEWNYVISPLK